MDLPQTHVTALRCMAHEMAAEWRRHRNRNGYASKGRWVKQHGARLASKKREEGHRLAARFQPPLTNRALRMNHNTGGEEEAGTAEGVIDLIANCSFEHGQDRDGRKVHYDRIGRLDVRTIERNYTPEQLVAVKHYEYSYSDAVGGIRSWALECFPGREDVESFLRDATRGGSATTVGPASVMHVVEQQQQQQQQHDRRGENGRRRFRVRVRRGPWSAHVHNTVAARMRALPPPRMRVLTVIDLDGTGSQHAGTFARAFCAEAGNAAEVRRPDGTHRIVVINTPWVLRVAWMAVKRVLSARVVDLVEVHAGPATQRLRQLVPEHHIPQELRGRCTSCGPGGCFGPDAPDQRHKLHWIRTGELLHLERRLTLPETTVRRWPSTPENVILDALLERLHSDDLPR